VAELEDRETGVNGEEAEQGGRSQVEAAEGEVGEGREGDVHSEVLEDAGVGV